MASAFEILSTFQTFKYLSHRRADRLTYLTWVLTQANPDESHALNKLTQLFEYHRPSPVNRVGAERSGTMHGPSTMPPLFQSIGWRVWLTPTDIDPAPLDLLHVSVQVDAGLRIGAPGVRPLDNGYYVVIQFTGEDEGLVLLEDYSWFPVNLSSLPPIEEGRERLERNFIMLDVENDEAISLKLDNRFRQSGRRWSTGPVDVSVGYIESGYGPHLAVAVVATRSEVAGYEKMADLKENDPRWAEERAELELDLRQRLNMPAAGAVPENLQERMWDEYNQQLHEDINGMEVSLPNWDAAAFTVQETQTLSGIEEIDVLDGEDVQVSRQYSEATLVAFRDGIWLVWKKDQTVGFPEPKVHQVASRLGDTPFIETTGHAGYVPNWLRLELQERRLENPASFPSPIVRAPEYRIKLTAGRYTRTSPHVFYKEEDADLFGDEWLTEQAQFYEWPKPPEPCEDCSYEVDRIR